MRGARPLEAGMSVIEFRTLGTLDLHAADGRELHSLLAQPKRIALLTYLCIAQPRGYHRRDSLLGLFWPEANEEHARTSLRKSLHLLRRALGDDAVLSRGDDEVAVDHDRIWCDAVSFEDLTRRGQFLKAIELYRGDLLPGFLIDEAPEFDQWLDAQRRRLRASAAESAVGAAEQLADGGDYLAAVNLARHSLSLADTDERVLRTLMTLQCKRGDKAGAIDTYLTFARGLAAKYQTEPGTESRALLEKIRSSRDPTANEFEAAQLELPDEVGTAVPKRSSLKTHGR